MTIKQSVLRVARALGLFWLAERLTAHGVRILCYHGISLDREHEFRGKLFMMPATFERRLRLLHKKKGFRVVSLDDAAQSLGQKRTLSRAVVITFDDGWLGTFQHALPALQRLGWPSTHYIATSTVVAGVPVFDVALGYLFWASKRKHVDLVSVDKRLSGSFSLPPDASRAFDAVDQFARAASEEEKADLLRRTSLALGVDFSEIDRHGLFRLMTPSQIREAAQAGADIQLHTHSHRFSVTERESINREIAENRAVLRALTDSSLQHFCYPSGVFHPRVYPWLRSAGVRSATTCQAGFNYPDTNPFELRRFLDGEDVSEIEFEAYMSGLLELARVSGVLKLARTFRARVRGERISPAPH